MLPCLLATASSGAAHSKASIIAMIVVSYVAILLVFAEWYHRLYRANPRNYQFNPQIADDQLKEFISREQQTVATLKQVQIALQELKDALTSADKLTEGAIIEGKSRWPLRLRTQNFRYEFERVTTRRGFTTAFHMDVWDAKGRFLNRLRHGYPELSAFGWSRKGDRERLSYLQDHFTGQTERRIAFHNKVLKSPATANIWSRLDFVYFSGITITTLGYGDILPNSTAVRMIVLAEVLLGVVFLGVFINVLLSSN